jgi:hypothetical protein
MVLSCGFRGGFMVQSSTFKTIGCTSILAAALGGCAVSTPDAEDQSAPPADARMQLDRDYDGVRITPDGRIDFDVQPEKKRRRDSQGFDSLYDPLPDFVL